MIEFKDNEELLKKLANAWRVIKDILTKVRDGFVRLCKRFAGVFYKLPGYKRLAKAKVLARFESTSPGKTNNWRKVHGLNLARSRC